MASKKQINIYREVYKKEDINTVIDTEFKTFTKPVEEVDTDTVQELFRLYDKLYYIIPVEGEEDSHQYLIRKSSELTSFEQSTEDIQPLLDEITQLRRQLLEANERQFEIDRSTARAANNNIE
jgi:hypothetical protein